MNRLKKINKLLHYHFDSEDTGAYFGNSFTVSYWRRLSAWIGPIIIIVTMIIVGCGGSGSSSKSPAIIPISVVTVSTVDLYVYPCDDPTEGALDMYPTLYLTQGKCHAVVAIVYNPQLNIVSAFVESIDPKGNIIKSGEIVLTGPTIQTDPLKIITFHKEEPQLYCGSYSIEFWIKDNLSLDSLSKFIYVDADSTCM